MRNFTSSALQPDLSILWKVSIFQRMAYQLSFSMASLRDLIGRSVISRQSIGWRSLGGSRSVAAITEFKNGFTHAAFLIAHFNSVQPLYAHLAHLFSDGMVALACQSVHARSQKEVSAGLMGDGEQFVDVALMIADVDDALRFELTNTPAAPTTTGWSDYEYVGTSSTSQNVQANDSVLNP